MRTNADNHFLKNMIKSIRNIKFYNSDTAYKKYIIGKYMPALYKKHITDLQINCVFCKNLVRSNCHKHCLKCRAGTYINCCPLLPGILYFENKYPYDLNKMTIPWFYKSSCEHFERLGAKKYFKNFKVLFSWVTLNNFEVLEGLTSGLSSNEKPCHICVSVDYGLYKNCSMQEDFEKSSPCLKIAAEIASEYNNLLDLG